MLYVYNVTVTNIGISIGDTSMKTVYFMRHGQTDMNVAEVLQGQVDCPLNEVGINQAKEAGAKFRNAGLEFDMVYSSPLSRAIDTAVHSALVDRDSVVIEPRIIEMDYGPFEGVGYADFDDDMWNWLKDPDNIPAPAGIESIPDLMARTGEFIDSLVDSDGNSILVVTHGVAIRSMLGNLHKLTGTYSAKVWGLPIPNCVLYKTIISEDGSFSEPEMIEL